MKRSCRVIAWSALLLVGDLGSASADLFLCGRFGWVDIEGEPASGVGQPYRGGLGPSLEVGFDLTRTIRFSGEFAPGFDQPRRAIEENRAVDGGRYSYYLGNVIFRMEPVEAVQPSLFLGGGRGVFHFDYADTGRIFRTTGREWRLAKDRSEGWTLVGGFALEKSIKRRLAFGVRLRYLMNFWPIFTEGGVYFREPSGDGVCIDAGFGLRLF